MLVVDIALSAGGWVVLACGGRSGLKVGALGIVRRVGEVSWSYVEREEGNLGPHL